MEWLPLVGAIGFLALLFSRFESIVGSVYTNSDAASPLVIADCLSSGSCDRGQVVLGHVPYLSTLWIDWATYWLPTHRFLWELWPYALSVCGAGLLAWMGWRLAGAWAGAVAFAVAVAVSPVVLSASIAQADRGTTWFSMCLLAAFLIWIETERAPGGRRLAVVTIGVCVVTGADLASDPLLVVCGLVPFVLAPLLVWARTRLASSRRVLFVSGLTGAVALAFAFVVAGTMRAAGFIAAPFGVGVATAAGIDHNLHLFIGDLSALAGGGALTRTDGATFGSRAVLAALVCLAIALIVVGALGALGRARRRSAQPAATVYLLFWAISSGLLCASFLLSNVPAGPGTSSARYLIGLVYAAAAAVPVLAAASTRTRVAAAVPVAAVCGLAFVSVLHNDLTVSRSRLPVVRYTSEVLRLLKRNELVRGYAGYWDAAVLTWASNERVRIAPIHPCGLIARRHLCPYRLNSIQGWYTPRRTRSFVLFDPTWDRFEPAISSGEAFGRPLAVKRFGPLELRVYGYDIASRFGASWMDFSPGYLTTARLNKPRAASHPGTVRLGRGG